MASTGLGGPIGPPRPFSLSGGAPRPLYVDSRWGQPRVRVRVRVYADWTRTVLDYCAVWQY